MSIIITIITWVLMFLAGAGLGILIDYINRMRKKK